MFNFMKKNAGDEEKERRKREKKLRKEAKGGSGSGVTGSMSTDELLRLEEVRRSLKIRGRRKEKEKLPSGITADYSADFFAALNADAASGNANGNGNGNGGPEQDRGNEEIVASVMTHIESRSAANGAGMGISLNYAEVTHSLLSGGLKNRFLPPVPPKPPKRGILKGSRSNMSNVHEEIVFTSSGGGTPEMLMRNTMQNEQLFEGNRGGGSGGSNSSQHGTSFTSVESLRSDGDNAPQQRAMTLPANARYGAPQTPTQAAHLHVLTSPSPSADSLTDTTNSSFATPPFSLSPVGESQGIDRWARVHSFEDVQLPLPPVQLVQLPPPRQLVIRRQKSPRQDFGFSLRKAICLDRTESLMSPIFRPVIFAEPGAGGGATGLLPGDRLIEVNGTPVGDLSREIIIEMIRTSGDAVTVKVQPVSELVELSKRCMAPSSATVEEIDHSINNGNCNTLRRSASKRFKRQSRHENGTGGIGKSASDVDIPDATQPEQVWLVHRGGFTAALRLPQGGTPHEEHKLSVRLLHNGEQLTVDEDDVEKQNSPALDLAEDICELKYLNEASVLHCLRQRYASNLIHTKAGPTLLVVNPMAPLSLYSEKVVSMFRGCKTEDMPPHVYSLAQTAYRSLVETRRDQSLIFMGRSGSGKTTSFKHALNYLALAAGAYNNFINAEKVGALCTILEAFGNTRTCLNSNATRMTQLLSLDFDQTGQIASASLQVLLPERQRAGRRLSQEHSFHIMTRLLAGAAGLLQKELHLENISSEDSHPFISLSQKLEDRHRAANDFMRTVQAFETLNIDAKAVRGIWSILAAIYHLGIAGITRMGTGSTARTQFANPTAARKAASLLGVNLEDLSSAAFGLTQPNVTVGSLSPSKSPTSDGGQEWAWECLEALVIGLYSEALAAVVALINRQICTSAHTIASIMLIDTPGFQNPASCGQQVGATLADLRHNYLQERLQMLFHHTTLVAPRDRYAQELVEIEMDHASDCHPGPLISLIDKAPQNHVVRSSQRDLREHDRRGLLWLLDEEAIYPNSNDDTFLERLFSHYGDREHHTLLRKCAGQRQFVLHHLQGTNPVLYAVDGWVRHSREHPGIRNAVSLLQDSSREEINRLYIGSLTRGSGAMVFCGSFAGLEGTQSLRRVSSIRRSFTTAGVKRNSIMLQVKFTVDGIIDTLRRTGTHFVHCYLLQHNAGKHAKYTANGSPSSALGHAAGEEELVNVPLLRSQLRGSQVLEAARLHRLGFPESVPLLEFVRRFGLLAGELATSKDISVEQILAVNELDVASYRIGPSQILFRSGVLNELEAKRDVLLADRIIQLQAFCRGYLARKKMSQRRVQELAVRCIQRNVKAFLAVRDWPWWRLLVRVTPLLNVHRTEEQLKIANEELLMLRAKLEKIEFDRSEVKNENQKLEAKPLPTFLSPMAPLAPADNAVLADSADIAAPPAAKDELDCDPEQDKATFMARVLAAMNGITRNNNNSSGSGSGSSLGTLKPPKPPSSQARKQLRLLPKQREQSPVLTNGHINTSTTTTTRNTQHSSNNYTTRNINHISSSSSSSNSQLLSTSGLGNCQRADAESHYEISLKLPISTGQAASATASAAASDAAMDRLRLLTRSPSPAYSISSRCSTQSSVSRTSRLETPPRRVFPQSYTRGSGLDPYEMRQLESSPVVFDANLSFVLGCQRQPVHQTLRPTPSFEDPRTSSAYLSEKIQNFLKRTDHVQEEWTAMGRRTRRHNNNNGSHGSSAASVGGTNGVNSRCSTPSGSSAYYDDYDTISLIERQRERNSMERCGSVGRTRSAQNILTKAFQLSKQLPHTPTSRGNSLARESSVATTASNPPHADDDDDRTIREEDDNELDELSELTVDLAEERSTAHIATERLEAETGERLKLEKELGEHQTKVKNLQEMSEKLEMELICAKSDLNGISEDEDAEHEEGSGGVYKLKYERVARELEFTKRRLQTQHEHDLEQLVGLKKQLEKKLSDAYEEVEEQRQVVGQWKRKAQKMTNEMNDLRMLLEEQNARNNLLEKKQRKFDAECQSLQDASRQERQAKERFGREKDVLQAEKFTLEQTLADTRLDLELKEEKLASLQRELEEMTFGGSTEEEFAQLRRSKNETERRAKEQEEELDEMAGQIQLLEQAKLRLEMSLETMRKEARRESQQRDEELEEVRGNGYKKIKALECQLETEHEERTLLLREKHELERRLSSMEDRDRVDRDAEEALNQKLRRDLRKYKALLKDAQTQLERLKADTPGKTLIRQLRNQLEDAESARTLAMKARQTAEGELVEVQAMFEESHRARNDAEERANTAHRDRAELQSLIEENEEELSELMKKYSATVKQLNAEQINVSEAEFKLTEVEAERNNLKEQVADLQHRLDNVENLGDPTMAVMSKRLEMRTKELESRLELEQATRARLEVQVSRHKESLEKLQNEVTQSKLREMQSQDVLKKSQKSLRDMREEFHSLSSREQESLTRRKDLEKKMEVMESEGTALKNDLRLALQRIADLQQAMEEEGEEELSESEESVSSVGSISDLEDRLRPVHVKRSSQLSINGPTIAPSTTRTLVCEKDDNSPRVTVTSPSSPHIHKLALAAKAIPDPQPDTKSAKKTTTATTTLAVTAAAPTTTTTNKILQNGPQTAG